MRFTIVGSHLCLNTIYAIAKCKEAHVDFGFKDVSTSLQDLRSFLALHEHDEVYRLYRTMSDQADYVEKGKIGLPCFVFSDGTRTLELEEALKKAGA